MRRHVPALAALATSLLMASCAAGPVGAKEKTGMSATMKDSSRIPFHDPAIVPMAQAIQHGDIARIRALAGSTDLAAHGEDNVTLLEWAIWTEQPEALAALLESGADARLLGMDQETVAHMAAMVEPPEHLRVLIAHKAPVDIVSPRGGRTPVFSAVQSGRAPQLEMLIEAGVDLNRKDSMGNTLLHEAASANNGKALLRLLEAGVDPRAVNAQGVTFQCYFFMTRERLLNAQGKQERAAVEAWLTQHGVARE
ncbi:ankyrin repeat domain-containing protein [Pseudoxanthomonas winnipegensis]|uniref:ankyrin repeat domain-containing protein n=1 Tax=Pseudoxanthomonas winnipegensis TaxID=2480810 RepID=UPI002578AFC9|nr:ankyrin repeat domain-containing protein [Pseudoxanthomonas winnipegensis]WJI14541.1 ankyrin repeat domain-containing protein [Pseudoxanthomonas winnipegensis]